MTDRIAHVWGADTVVSKPIPPDRETQVSFGGFAFTTGGLIHDLTEADVEETFFPMFSPEGFDGTR